MISRVHAASPSSRTQPRRTGPSIKAVAAGRIGDIGVLQLLSGQEPRRLRRGRCSCDQRCGLGTTLRDAARLGSGREIHPHASRASTIGWTRSRPPSSASSWRISRLGPWRAARSQSLRRAPEPGHVACETPERGPNADRHVYHVYAVRLARRDAAARRLEAAGIAYGNPLSDPCASSAGLSRPWYTARVFPAAERFCARNAVAADVPGDVCPPIDRVSRRSRCG